MPSAPEREGALTVVRRFPRAALRRASRERSGSQLDAEVHSTPAMCSNGVPPVAAADVWTLGAGDLPTSELV